MRREKNNFHVAWKCMVDAVETRIRLIKGELNGHHFTKLKTLRRMQRALVELQHDATLLYRLRQDSKRVAHARWERRVAEKQARGQRKVPRREASSR